MNDIYSVRLAQLVREFDLHPLFRSSDYEEIHITVDEINRPGLELLGHLEHFEPMRLQIIGTVETSFLERLSSEERIKVFSRLFSYHIPALIISRNLKPVPECLEMAEKYNISILQGSDTTSYLISSLIAALKVYLAPRITRRGVLVEVYGEGLLLLGEDGIGKSEASTELLKRGHRLIADEMVEIKRVSAKKCFGLSPEPDSHDIELRGIGVVNAADLFGMGSIKESADIDLIINIVPWKNGFSYDRLGLETEYMDIMGVKIPALTIPVTPGRNLAVILEVAAMNNRQRKMGYNAALDFTEQINQHFDNAR